MNEQAAVEMAEQAQPQTPESPWATYEAARAERQYIDPPLIVKGDDGDEVTVTLTASPLAIFRIEMQRLVERRGDEAPLNEVFDVMIEVLPEAKLVQIAEVATDVEFGAILIDLCRLYGLMVGANPSEAAPLANREERRRRRNHNRRKAQSRSRSQQKSSPTGERSKQTSTRSTESGSAPSSSDA